MMVLNCVIYSRTSLFQTNWDTRLSQINEITYEMSLGLYLNTQFSK